MEIANKKRKLTIEQRKKATERNILYRATKSDQAKATIREENKAQHKAMREEQTSEEKAAVQDKNTIRHQVVRDAKSEDQKKRRQQKVARSNERIAIGSH